MKSRKLHLFNPENDIALAFNASHINLSVGVKTLRKSGALLPLWWAEVDDAVLVTDGYDKEYVEMIRQLFGIETEVVESVAHGSAVGAPWGWSRMSANELHNAGASVPDETTLERIRNLSHRRTSIKIFNELTSLSTYRYAGHINEAHSLEEIYDIMRSTDSKVYLKAPWSSSGRGVIKTDISDLSRHKARIRNIIRQQGSIMCEQSLDNIQDFAMLFFIDDDSIVSWRGYSIFTTHGNTAYTGNILASDEELENILIAHGAPAHILTELKNTLPSILKKIVGNSYHGWLGIDMLLTADGRIDPCVELNLRMTMGVVAHEWTSRYLASGLTGYFSVAPGTTGSVHPTPQIDAGKLTAGSIILTPPGSGFEFRISIDKCL